MWCQRWKVCQVSNDAHGAQQLSYKDQGSLSQFRLINIYRWKDLGAEKSMTCLNIQLASDRASKLGTWLWAPTCQEPPSGNWIRSLYRRHWEHLSTYTLQSFILFRSPAKSSLSVKSRSISLHSMACYTERKKNAVRARNCPPGSRTHVLGPCIAWHQGLTAVPQVVLEYSIKAILTSPKAEDTFLSWGPAYWLSCLSGFPLHSKNAESHIFTGKTNKQAASPML